MSLLELGATTGGLGGAIGSCIKDLLHLIMAMVNTLLLILVPSDGALTRSPS